MLGIGIGEMILIAGLALVVFGPEKFPDFAKIVMRTVRDLRGYVDDIQSEISKELKPVQRELKQLSKYDPEKYIDALTKTTDSSTAKTTPADGAKAASPPASAAADPTDRQDDSFDYGPAAKPEPAQAAPEASPSAESVAGDASDAFTERGEAGQGADGADNQEDFEFSEPPVERLD